MKSFVYFISLFILTYLALTQAGKQGLFDIAVVLTSVALIIFDRYPKRYPKRQAVVARKPLDGPKDLLHRL